MADVVQFELVSPERLVLSSEVSMVVVPGAEGDFGVLPGHSPMISNVRSGVISIYNDRAIEARIFVDGGFADPKVRGGGLPGGGASCHELAGERVQGEELGGAA